MTKVISDLTNLNLNIESDMHLVIYFKELIGDFEANIRIIAGKKVHLEHIILGGSLNCKINFVLEKEASLVLNTGFSLSGTDKLNYCYFAEHLGANSKSMIRMVGSLDDSAEKMSELKIHFAKGATGAVGDEKEKISIFSNQAKNTASPTILSDESEAEGHHGFSSCHISEDEQSYLCSRGVDSDKIKLILAKNDLLRVAKLTKKADIIKEIYEY